MPIIKKTPSVAPKKTAPKKLAPKKAAPSKPVEDGDGPGAGRTGVVSAGWDGAEELSSSGDFVKSLDFANDAAKSGDTSYFIIKFLDDEPFANTPLHWVERKGKRGFVCAGDGCPLCAVGLKPAAKFRFNVAVIGEEEPVLRAWVVGWQVLNKIKVKAQAPHTRPLTKKFYLVSRSGRNWRETEYSLDAIDKSEIESEYGFYVPSKDELDALPRYTIADIEREFSTMAELEAVAEEIIEGDG